MIAADTSVLIDYLQVKNNLEDLIPPKEAPVESEASEISRAPTFGDSI